MNSSNNLVKKIVTLSAGCVVVAGLGAVGVGVAQAAPLYSNASADPALPALTATTQSLGGPLPDRTPTPVPAGYLWNELQNQSTLVTNSTMGFITDVASNRRSADDFTVTGPGWELTGATFYAYVDNFYTPGVTTGTGATPIGSTFLRIWDGRPGDAGSSVIFGDLTTNRQVASSPTNLFRIFNTFVSDTSNPPPVPTISRMVYAQTVDFDVTLDPGTYWLEWTFGRTPGVTGSIVSPTVTIAGTRGLPGFNARQGSGNFWFDVDDTGYAPPSVFMPNRPRVPQDYPFLLAGSVVPEPATAGVGLLLMSAAVLARRRR